MNVNIRKELSEFIRSRKEGKISQEEAAGFLSVLKNKYGDIGRSTIQEVDEKEDTGDSLMENVPANSSPVQALAEDIAGNVHITAVSVSRTAPTEKLNSGKTILFNLNSGATTTAFLEADLGYKQESVISIIKDFPIVNYDIDFTSGNINREDCRQLMKFIMAIVISENENIITEESVEEALSLLDIPMFFDFILSDMLGQFLSFIRKVLAAKKQVYLVDARHRWAAGTGVADQMSFGEIPCEIYVDQPLQGDKLISEIYLSFTMFNKRYNLKTAISIDNSQVYNLRLNIAGR